MSQMTKADVAKLLAMATANFPSQQERDMRATAELWHRMLVDMPLEMAQAALMKVLATAKFFPTVAEIREAAASFTTGSLPDPEEAWGEVVRAVGKHGAQNPPECLKKNKGDGWYTSRMPWDFSEPIVGRSVEAMWGTWMNCCESMPPGGGEANRAQFIRMYGTMQKRQKDLVQLPPSVQEFAKKIADRMKPQLLTRGEE